MNHIDSSISHVFTLTLPFRKAGEGRKQECSKVETNL
jgi:hypothetical protein